MIPTLDIVSQRWNSMFQSASEENRD